MPCSVARFVSLFALSSVVFALLSECRYSCPIVLRALLLFEQLDSDDDDSLNEKEFALVCFEIQKRNMYAAFEQTN
jgi:hypothetical protein